MTSSGHALLRAALVGTALGAAWGVLARTWMRLVSTTPEFSWPGTLFIVLLSAVFGLCVGVAAQARRQRRSRWWLLAALPGMLIFAGQGMLFLPGCLVASLFMARYPAVARVGAWLALLPVPVLLWWTQRLDEDTMLPMPTTAQVALLVGMPVLGWWLAWHGKDLWPTRRRAGDQPVPVAATPARGAPVAQSASPDRARNSLRSDSSREVPAGPA